MFFTTMWVDGEILHNFFLLLHLQSKHPELAVAKDAEKNENNNNRLF